MRIRSKAPLRIGLAGGGTDLDTYSGIYGGAILNATINMHAHTTIYPSNNGKIVFNDLDKPGIFETETTKEIPVDENYILHKGIYNRIVKEFSLEPLSFELHTSVDAPPGSGLGSSSTLVVSIVGAFCEWLKLPLGEYDIAKLAYDIEREDLKMPGGKQDQYAATFGGVNFMEFYKDNKVIVNPLRISQVYLNELSLNLLLYYTETSRLSSTIIENQKNNIINRNESSLQAMHNIKEQAIRMKEALLKGDFDSLGHLLDYGWKNKKQMANGISNIYIDKIYNAAMKAGATGGKISGAGGGGFMIFYCPGNTADVIRKLKEFGGEITRYDFTKKGLLTWTV